MHLSVVVSFFSRSWPSRRVRPRHRLHPPKSSSIMAGGSPRPQYVRDHWREMEKIPFDGVGMVVPSIARPAAGQT